MAGPVSTLRLGSISARDPVVDSNPFHVRFVSLLISPPVRRLVRGEAPRPPRYARRPSIPRRARARRMSRAELARPCGAMSRPFERSSTADRHRWPPAHRSRLHARSHERRSAIRSRAVHDDGHPLGVGWSIADGFTNHGTSASAASSLIASAISTPTGRRAR